MAAVTEEESVTPEDTKPGAKLYTTQLSFTSVTPAPTNELVHVVGYA
jgi:hypothetical protein